MILPGNAILIELSGHRDRSLVLITGQYAVSLVLRTTPTGTEAHEIGRVSTGHVFQLFEHEPQEPASAIWDREPKLRDLIEELVPCRTDLLDTVPAGSLFVCPYTDSGNGLGREVRAEPGYRVFEAGETFPRHLRSVPGARFLDDPESCVFERTGLESTNPFTEVTSFAWTRTRISNANGKAKRQPMPEA